MPQDKTGDFESWLKGQNAEPKTVKAKPAGDFENWLRGKEQPEPSAPRNLMPTEQQEFGRRLPSLDESLRQSTQANRGRPVTRTPGGPNDPFNESLQEQNRRAFEQKPTLEQWKDRAYDAIARGGQSLANTAINTTPLGKFLPSLKRNETARGIDRSIRTRQEERSRELEQRRQARPSSLSTDVAEGIIEAAPQVGALGLTGGAGAFPQAVIGGATAAGSIPVEQWRQAPGRSLTQTAIGAAAPIIGGKAGQVVGGKVAGKLASPAAQAAARVGGEVLGGAAGNVGATGAEQLAFEGRLNPRELVKSGAVGAALSTPGALAAARQPLSPKLPRYRTDEGAIIAPESSIANRRLLPPGNPEEIPTARLSQAESPPRGIPMPPSTQELNPETFGYVSRRRALPAGNPEEIPTAQLPRPTERMQIPDAPATQEMPSFKEWLAAENAQTGELPKVETGKTGRQITAEEPPEFATVGRPVTQEYQVPGGLKKAESFASREDARQGHFEGFDDQELVDEIRRMEGLRNDATRGKSKLSREEIEANNFDLKVAVDQQKERGRLQRMIGVDPANRIAPRTPGRPARKIQHSAFGEVTEAENQKGVPAGKIRVTDEGGTDHLIQNPRTRGNQSAAFVRSIPAEAMPELQAPNAPKPPNVSSQKPPTQINYTIPEAAAPELSRKTRGHVMAAGLGFLGGGGKLPSRAEAAETVGGLQTAAQLGNPKFVIRNVLQHVAFGKQERTATRLAAVVDWAYSKATGKPRQIAAPQGSDLASYVRNWGKAVKAYKSGQALPGGNSPIAPTANANVVDKAVNKLMTYINEIPDAANWQTRFEGSLQSIVRKNAHANMGEAVEQAKLEADRASLRDKNFASTALTKLKQALNTASSPIFGTDKFGLGDFVSKYAQVPGALLKRGIERSPLGLFEVAKQAATPGPYRRRNTLLALSRVAEGAATGVGLGAGLAAAGVLVGPEDENKTGRGFEREEGVRGYSLNGSALLRLLSGDFSREMKEGDTLFSIDWLQPWAMNLSAGAALWGLHKNGKLGATSGAKATGEAVYNSLAKTLDVMGDQSVLKNLSKYMDKASGDTFSDKFFNFAKAVGLDVPSSFVPSLARQARQVADPYERDTRPDQRGGFKGFAKEAAGRALAQIPGVSSRFPTRPSLLTGEDRKTGIGEMSTAGRIGSQFLPANVSTYTPNDVAKEISRLNRAGEKVSVSFPAPHTNKRTGEREATSSLRGRERQFAQTWSRMSQEMIQDAFYKDADNETKAAAFAGLKRHLSGLGKEDFEEKSIDEIVEAAMETVEKRRDKEEK